MARLVIEDSRPIAQAARQLGINDGTLGKWVARFGDEHRPKVRHDAPTTLSRRFLEMNDPFEARQELGTWFMQMLNELDQDRVEDASAMEKLKGMISEAFAQWRLDTGYGLYGLPVEPPPGDE